MAFVRLVNDVLNLHVTFCHSFLIVVVRRHLDARWMPFPSRVEVSTGTVEVERGRSGSPSAPLGMLRLVSDTTR